LTDIIPVAVPNLDPKQTEKKLLALAASAEQASEHPLGQALVRAAAERKVSLDKPKGFNALSGRGIEATIGGQSVLIGSRRLLEKNGVACGNFAEQADALSDGGKTVIWVSAGGKLLGLLAVADVIKEDSAAAISKLKNLGIKTLMLTGDNARTARGVASEVGIDDILAEVLPEDKAEKVSELKTAYAVGMVGDGINDAPALVTADVGIAIGSGTDISIESADIVLMRSNLLDVPALIDLSRRTIRNIKQNLFWAFGYNVVGIPIAAGLLHLFGGPLLNPMFAAAAMSLSSVSVLTNALRLRKG
jgi:Cu+-exporting ATPase